VRDSGRYSGRGLLALVKGLAQNRGIISVDLQGNRLGGIAIGTGVGEEEEEEEGGDRYA
jgi:hypothetical protein